MKKPFFSNDANANNKKLKQVVEGADQLGDRGKFIAETIKKGDFEDVSGYKTLIGSIKKSGNPAPFQGHPGWPVGQTLKRMEKSVDIPNSRKVLEDVKNGVYDIDYGELAVSGPNKYSKAYQFKSAGDPSKVANSIVANTIENQLKNADSALKIFEIEMRSGTLDDLLTHSQSILDRVSDAKSRVPNLIINVTDLSGNVIKTY